MAPDFYGIGSAQISRLILPLPRHYLPCVAVGTFIGPMSAFLRGFQACRSDGHTLGDRVPLAPALRFGTWMYTPSVFRGGDGRFLYAASGKGAKMGFNRWSMRISLGAGCVPFWRRCRVSMVRVYGVVGAGVFLPGDASHCINVHLICFCPHLKIGKSTSMCPGSPTEKLSVRLILKLEGHIRRWMVEKRGDDAGRRRRDEKE